jgi:hypothetical protein
MARGCELPLLQEVLAQKRRGPLLDQDLPGSIFDSQVAPTGQKEPGGMARTDMSRVRRDEGTKVSFVRVPCLRSGNRGKRNTLIGIAKKAQVSESHRPSRGPVLCRRV